MDKLIDIYTICWNEEKILPDFIKWYRDRLPNCHIVVMDNMSTDKTQAIALEHGCEVRAFDTGNQMDEQTLINIRNNCWKDSKAQWALVVDCDELVDIDEDFLLSLGTENIFKCNGYEMFGTKEDTIKTLTQGCESVGYCKPVLFRPWVFQDVNFGPGSHSANPVAKNAIYVAWSAIHPNLYHTKWRSWENGIERAHLLAKRRSDHSRSMGWNIHYEFDDSVHKEYYENGMKNRVKVR